MQSISNPGVPPAGPKNYVFVDEHNRHKRLKVMRACEGCRRRKIKCDSATTNTWPCAACTRLKLHCVPPVGGVEGDAGSEGLFTATDGSYDYQPYAPDLVAVTPQNPAPQQAYTSSFHSDQGNPAAVYDPYPAHYQKPTFAHLDDSYGNVYSGTSHFAAGVNSYQSIPGVYAQPRHNSETQVSVHSDSTSVDQCTAEDLSQHLGDLKIGENGIAPYIREQKKDSNEPDAPIQEPEMKIVSFSTDAGSQIRIPPALMPTHDEAIRYFQIFFKDVHPYAPVLCRNQFYHQWHTDKASISPLVLEAIFACAGRMSDDPAGGAQWLALANKHEGMFLDSPRISTLQALLLLLKARESAPKKGYYYRSWMTCKTVVSMAKDLELHEHYETHKVGESCGSDPVECLSKTRIWQTLLVCEMMVGAPQGRTDMGVDPSSVDISPNPPNSDIDDFERSISKQFAYFVRNARNIRAITDLARKLKNKANWQSDRGFLSYNVAFIKWPDELPKDLQVSLAPNDIMPNLPSHFVGNMHTHYHLGVVMLRRAQLSASQNFASDNTWKSHMTVCYNSAKTMCRLQEAILANFNLAGLLCMQRGINFTIYAILTCVMVHLIAITSPDPDFNSDSKEYFVRHMRILERCIQAWPMPETEAQVNGLRAAFSANLDKPFELKASFPLGTPPEQFRPSPPARSDSEQRQHLMIPQSHSYVTQHTSHVQNSYLATPPVSAISSDSKPDSPHFPQRYGMDSSPYHAVPPNAYYHPTSAPELQAQWNPTPIIDQFSTAFAIPASHLAPPSSMYSSSPPGNVRPSYTSAPSSSTHSPQYPASGYPPQQQQQYFPPQSQPQTQQSYQVHSPSAMGLSSQGHSDTDAYAGVFVTPKEWQQSVASVYGPGGLKRSWDYDDGLAQQGHVGDEHLNKRR